MHDEEYFTRVEKIRAKLYRIAYPYFNSESMAVDVTDEAIYRGYLKKRQLREDDYMETWLIRILMNLCKSRYKKNKTLVELDGISEEETAESFDNLPLRLALQQLAEEYRRIVVLKYFGGYTTAEIAKLLSIPQGTVATRLRKALQLLRIDMEE